MRGDASTRRVPTDRRGRAARPLGGASSLGRSRARRGVGCSRSGRTALQRPGQRLPERMGAACAASRSPIWTDALYVRRSVVRVLGMRRTMFVVPRDLAAVIDAACTRALVPAERRRLLKLIGDQGIAPHPDRWLSRVAQRDAVGTGRTRPCDRQGAHRRRSRAHRQAQLRRGPQVGRHRRPVHAAAVPAGHGGAHRPRTAARHVDFQPVPVGQPPPRGSTEGCRPWSPSRHARSWCGAGWPRSDRAPCRTWRGGPAGPSARPARRWRRPVRWRSIWTPAPASCRRTTWTPSVRRLNGWRCCRPWTRR